jgi:hypothetical protein
MFASSLDGNSGSDYRVYANNTHQTATALYAAGSQNNSAAYYVDAFPGQTAPAAQTALFAEQTGTTLAGSMGFAWRDVEVRKEGAVVTYSVDGTLIATVDFADTLTLSTNISLGLFDSNAGSSTSPNDFLNTVVFDNIRVSPVPEPATAGLIALGAGALALARRRRH